MTRRAVAATVVARLRAQGQRQGAARGLRMSALRRGVILMLQGGWRGPRAFLGRNLASV